MPSPALALDPLATTPDATITVPGSKSHTNRALICAALADGTSVLEGALFADDTWAMVRALSSLGLAIDTDEAQARLTVIGCRGRPPAGPATLNVAQSGTTGRFLAALAALGPGPYVLDGDPQLRARPFGPMVDALRALGATVDGEGLPLRISGPVGPGRLAIPGSVSSQFLSGLLLSAPAIVPGSGSGSGDGAGQPALVVDLDGPLVSRPYVELTLATMAAFGAEVEADADALAGHDGGRFVVPASGYRAAPVAIEPDASAATYFFAAAAVTGGRVRIPGLGSTTIQGDLGFVDVLERMGATVVRTPDWTEVTGPSRLEGVEVDMGDMSDAAQTLAVVATFARTPTRVTGIGFIRHKETDRLRAVVTELNRRGIRAVEEPDGFTVEPGVPEPGPVATYDDHRMAMSFALLGLRHPGILIEDPSCVTKTFPRYFETLERLRS